MSIKNNKKLAFLEKLATIEIQQAVMHTIIWAQL